MLLCEPNIIIAKRTKRALHYLWNVLHKCDAQFNIGEVVQIIQPGDLLGHGNKEGDKRKGPANHQQPDGHFGNLLITSLKDTKQTKG